MDSQLLPIITDWFLIRRVETIQNALNVGDIEKFHRVVDNTIKTITNSTRKETHAINLHVYMKNLEMAQMLCYLDVISIAAKHIDLAIDVIMRDLATMTPSYIIINRIKSSGNIGTLSELSDDILYYIGTMVK